MTIHIPKQYLWYGGIAIAAGLAYWYLKQAGYWDQWFNAAGQVIPVGPQPQPVQTQDQSIVPGANLQPSSMAVN
jgi:hypothetical protein